LGKDIIIQAGGGIHGHSKGTVAGAIAMRQANDACLKKIPLKTYSKTHLELKEALKQWK
jgi:ribulose 1,5-bisphosphate carboxylase large subunit-like protein